MVWHAEVALLVNALAGLAGVNPDRAGVNDAPDSSAAGGLKHVESAAGVCCLRFDRHLRDFVDVGSSSQVQYGVAAAHRQFEFRKVAEFAELSLDVIAEGRRTAVVDDRPVASVNELIDYMGADKAGASGYKYFHCVSRSDQSLAGW